MQTELEWFCQDIIAGEPITFSIPYHKRWCGISDYIFADATAGFAGVTGVTYKTGKGIISL